VATKESEPPATPFERFVAAVLRVPKTEADAVEHARMTAQNGVKRGPKPKRPSM
jgi:hypothetical protein